MKNRNNLILLAMALGLFMAAIDNTITSAAISHILDDIGGFERMSWVFTAYVLASTSTMLVFGKLSDIFGRKLFYLIGIAFFLVGSALCGMAGNMEQLIIFRAIQGIGTGALMPISFTIIYTLFADPKQAAKLSAVFAAIFGLSSVVGPQIGTFLAENWGWRWCFYVNVPVGIVSFLVLLAALKESRSDRKPSIDYVGTLFLVISTVSLMLGLEWGGKDYAWSSWQIIGLFATAAVVGTLFVLVELKAQEPVLPLHLFKNRMVLSTSVATLAQGAIMFAAITYLPIFAVAVLGQKNSNSILTPMMLSLIVGAITFGFLQSRFAFRTLMTFSMACGVAASYLLSTIPDDASKTYMIFLMAFLGFGAIGPLMSVAQNAIVMSVDKKYIGVSSSIINFWRNIGGVLGASITSTIVNNNMKTLIQDGATALHLPADKIDTMAKPELLLHAGSSLPPQIREFVRHSLGTAIDHGFVLAICFGVLGLVAALSAGPGRFVKPDSTEYTAESAAKVAEGI